VHCIPLDSHAAGRPKEGTSKEGTPQGLGISGVFQSYVPPIPGLFRPTSGHVRRTVGFSPSIFPCFFERSGRTVRP
jgi:hypothetical protein